jgi:hypothetical protein
MTSRAFRGGSCSPPAIGIQTTDRLAPCPLPSPSAAIGRTRRRYSLSSWTPVADGPANDAPRRCMDPPPNARRARSSDKDRTIFERMPRPSGRLGWPCRAGGRPPRRNIRRTRLPAKFGRDRGVRNVGGWTRRHVPAVPHSPLATGAAAARRTRLRPEWGQSSCSSRRAVAISPAEVRPTATPRSRASATTVPPGS